MSAVPVGLDRASPSAVPVTEMLAAMRREEKLIAALPLCLDPIMRPAGYLTFFCFPADSYGSEGQHYGFFSFLHICPVALSFIVLIWLHS